MSRPRPRRFVVGLLGGIASGKSTLAAELAACGAEVVDADALAHLCLERPDIRGRVKARFGAGVLAADGSIDRKALAAVAFADAGDRRDLEAIVHPCVRREIEARLAARGPGLLVLDVPLLEESGLAEVCDATIFLEAPLRARLARAASRGWSAQELRRREASQTPPEAKKARADFVLRNEGPRARLRLAARRLHTELLDRARARAPRMR
jgi:dephospho-CoA kinase